MLEYLVYMNSMQASSDAASARGAAGNALSRTEEMSYRLGAIELAMETLVRLGVEQSLFTEEQFLAKAREIDAEDGVLDGRRDLSRMRKVCDHCGKPNNGTKSTCMWCGGDITQTQLTSNQL